MNFDKTYYDTLNSIQPINEGKFKSLVASGLMAGSVASGANLPNPQTQNPPTQTHTVQQSHSDDAIVRYISKFTKNAEASGRARLTAYTCPTGHLTIGYGTNIESTHNANELKRMGYTVSAVRRKAQNISKPDAERLLEFGLRVAIADAKQFLPNFDSQPIVVKGILTDMAYNLGLTKLNKFEDMREALMNYDYSKASDEMVDSLWYDQVGTRSKKLANLMRKVRR